MCSTLVAVNIARPFSVVLVPVSLTVWFAACCSKSDVPVTGVLFPVVWSVSTYWAGPAPLFRQPVSVISCGLLAVADSLGGCWANRTPARRIVIEGTQRLIEFIRHLIQTT